MKKNRTPRNWRSVPLVILFAAVLANCTPLEHLVPPPPTIAEGGPPTVRRLTEAQYRQSITDIFGAEIKIAGRFEPDVRREGLLAVGASEVAVTRAGFEQYDVMARNIAAQVVSETLRARFLNCTPVDLRAADQTCAATVLQRYGQLLHRRPLSAKKLNAYVKVAASEAERLKDFYAGLSFGLAGMLVAPEFLFRIDIAEPDPIRPGYERLDPYAKASRLSFLLWNTTPDQMLLDAAGEGELDSAQGLSRHVDRMLSSPRLRDGVRAFFSDMLKFDGIDTVSKDGTIFPRFSRSVMQDAKEQTLRTVVNHLIAQNGDYRELFTTRRTLMTRNLGIVYRVPVAPEVGWESYEFTEEDGRAGLLTQLSFLALHGPPGRSSPTLRGMAVRELLMCQKVPAPPGDVDFSEFEASGEGGSVTVRDRLTEHRSNPVCAGCHKIMDPIGLALENFDGLGQYRKSENGAIIDASGELDGIAYQDVKGLGDALRGSPATVSCLVNNVYRYAVGHTVNESERKWVSWLEDTFARNGYRLPDLLRQIATSETFYAVSTSGSEVSQAAQAGNGAD
jgi:hypothetical protein